MVLGRQLYAYAVGSAVARLLKEDGGKVRHATLIGGLTASGRGCLLRALHRTVNSSEFQASSDSLQIASRCIFSLGHRAVQSMQSSRKRNGFES